MSILQTIDLKKYYGAKPNITRALDGVNFSVEDGEFVAVVGTSGSGKSTLLNMMGGLDTPTSGNVIVRDKELSKMNDEQLTIFRRRNIGFIFQNYNLVPILNGRPDFEVHSQLHHQQPLPLGEAAHPRGQQLRKEPRPFRKTVGVLCVLQGLDGSFQLGQGLFQGAPGAGQDDALVLCPGFAEDVTGVQPELGLVDNEVVEGAGVQP